MSSTSGPAGHWGSCWSASGSPTLSGAGDAATTIPLIVQAGHHHVLHLCGEEVRPFDPLDLSITQHIVYRTDAMTSSGRVIARISPKEHPYLDIVHSAAVIAGPNEAAARLLNVKAKSISASEAREKFGKMFDFLSINNELDAARAKRDLRWEPEVYNSILDEIENGSYRNCLNQA